jgi:2-keto-4-pentenoate hydratase
VEEGVTHPTPERLAALSLREAYRTGQPCAPVRDLVADGDVAAAYGIQEINTRLWLEQGRRLVGRKIGLTSAAVQKQLGVDQPDFGMLFADMAACDGEPIPAGAVLQAKVEAEIAFVLERDLDVPHPTVADVMRAIACAVVAIEVVGSRIANWDIRLVDTVADNASSGMFVLGNTPYALAGLDLRDCRMEMTRDGNETVSTGVGHACLGHPLNATRWLAAKLVEVGRPLKAGDVILSGALGPMVTVAPGQVFEARVTGLGSVRAAFAAGG